MGIKGLWSVLTPYCEKKSLHEIQGEKLAVDLSGWVCDSQNVTDYHIQPKLYLRTIYILLSDIKPIFILEGDAPELKQDVMAARNAIQFRGAAPQIGATSSKPDVSRKRFKTVLKECESLLKCMGVICIKGTGEAEATCAILNARGFVDAVVSQDSDCFAYGARRVYRNFSVSNSAGGGAMQGSVDCYDADLMFKSNGFGRNKMVALALLCGCDYGVGACGSSINTVVSYLHTVSEENIIHRLLSWVCDPQKYEELSCWALAPGRCDLCGHVGRTHLKNGCPVCATHRGCNNLGHKAKVAEVKRELSLRSRALSSKMLFPEPKVMKEFLNTTYEDIDLDTLKAPTPSLIQFTKLMTKKLDWTERYCVEKFLPLLTKCHLQDLVACRTLKPIAIKKKRNPRGIPSYEVLWENINGEYEGLIPDDQFEEGEEVTQVWTSIERQDLMRRCHPDLVNAYEESIKKPPKIRKTREKNKENKDLNKPKRKYNKKAKRVDEVETLNISLKKLNLTPNTSELNSSKAQISVCVNKLKRKLRNHTKSKKNTIESYVISKKKKLSISQCSKSNNSLRINMNINNKDIKKSIEPIDKKVKKTLGAKHRLSYFNSSTEDINENDLSDIIDQIVTRAPTIKTATVNTNLVKFVFENKSMVRKSIKCNNRLQNNCSTPICSPLKNNKKFSTNLSKLSAAKMNTSYFFDKLTDDCDAFEMSINYKTNSKAVIEDCDVTVDYSLPDVYF